MGRLRGKEKKGSREGVPYIIRGEAKKDKLAIRGQAPSGDAKRV
jgi:hypothetical protein